MFSQVSVVSGVLPLCGPLLLRSLCGLLRGEDGALLCQGSLEEEAADKCSSVNGCEVISSYPSVFKTVLCVV